MESSPPPIQVINDRTGRGVSEIKSTGGGREPLTQLDAVSQFWSDQSEADMPRTRSGV
jgi:hypothetical protein